MFAQRPRTRYFLADILTVVVLTSLASDFLAPASAQITTAADPAVTALIAEVEDATLLAYANQLSGAVPATVGGQPYTFATRETTSGTPIAKATQYVYEFMQARGLAVRYEAWNACGIANRNVVAEKTGENDPGEVVLVTAHVDSTTEHGNAPGADDDASGTAAVLHIAEIMADASFQRTVQFVLFTGEEQGLCGSEAFAGHAATAGINVVAVYNMDMIAYDSDEEPILRLHTRRTGHAGYAADMEIANTFLGVVEDYGLQDQLSPRILADGNDESDIYSFWVNDFPGILAIEDDGPVEDDFNPYYHTSRDTVSAYNQTYFANFVKASVGTVALLARITPTDTPTPAPTPLGSYRAYLPAARR